MVEAGLNITTTKKRRGRPAKVHTNGVKNGVKKTNGHVNGVMKAQISEKLTYGWDPKLMKKKMKFMDRKLTTGLGRAVAKRTILRDGEEWVDVAVRVARGNTSLIPEKLGEAHRQEEYTRLRKYISSGILLMSGRHLQHGDENQAKRNMEVFTNCSTASNSFLLFYLLLNGSGVGRAYDDDMCVVNWDYMPIVHCVISEDHPDFVWGEDESVREAKHKYGKVYWFEVPDSREGWAQAIEKMEVMAYERKYKDEVLILDFSKVRPKGSPIGGMQDRPSSGPKPLMQAIKKVTTIKNAGLPTWKQSMFIDHYLAECVLVGGARRSARIATKNWTDPDILDFINIKRGGFLWSANNSVAVDEKFWQQKTAHSRKVLDAVLRASYHHDTGEPGFINQYRLVQNDTNYDGYFDGKYVGNSRYTPGKKTAKMLAHIAKNAGSKLYTQIPNPCGEISLNMLGGYCVIADVVPYFAPDLEAAEEAFRIATRALMRVNLMDSLYNREVKRTNRIGVSMTGVHEFAWNSFRYTFRDLIDEKKSLPFWSTMARFKRVVVEETEKYSKTLGVTVPHTNTTIKPAGTTSKLFGLCEGAHLPAMREYIRWVQFRDDDPLVKKYKKMGYPTKELKSYSGTTVIGFPTQPEICKLGMNGELVTAAEATPEEQFKWLMLLEKYWIVGIDEYGNALKDTGNQVSYTLKYKKDKVSYQKYKQMVKRYQSRVKCCSVMPQQDVTAYEYQPEEAVTIGDFTKVLNEITGEDFEEDIDLDTLKCQAGACPI
jgi:adenosylcobalamin-dependent ribonucleoside-triphosphate reductase